MGVLEQTVEIMSLYDASAASVQALERSYSPKTNTLAEAVWCLVGSFSALQRYVPLSSMVTFGKDKALLIIKVSAGIPLVLFVECRFS